jgi:hypothetical protein
MQVFATEADPIGHETSEETYMKRERQSLRVGEAVVFVDYPDTAAGEIVDRLDDDYVLVRWADFSTPTTHCTRVLRRVAASRHLLSEHGWH